DLVCEALLDLARPGERLRVRGDDERRAHERLAELPPQQPRRRMLGDPYADGAPPLVLQAARRRARGPQQECIGSRQAGLEDAELPGLDERKAPDLGEARAHEREMMMA